MRKNKTKLVLLLVGVISFGLIYRGYRSEINNPNTSTKAAHQIAADDFKLLQAVDFCKDHNMQCMMIGGSQTSIIKSLAFAFRVPRNLTKEEGRAILVDCADRLVNAANQDESLKPFSPEGGFSHQHVAIDLYTGARDKVYYPIYSVMSFDQGDVIFFADYEDSSPLKTRPFDVKEIETYKEALALVNQSKEKDALIN